MKESFSRLILVVFDVFVIYMSIVLGYYTRVFFAPYIDINLTADMSFYTNQVLIYIIVIGTFSYEGIYKKRYDFWHESRQILKSLIFSIFAVFSLLSLLKYSDQYSRFIIVFSFLYMLILFPILKRRVKFMLYSFGLWSRAAKIYGDDTFLEKEIFKNHYLGYKKSTKKEAQTIFINSHNLNAEELENIVDKQIAKNKEVVFIPLINGYNMVDSIIYEMANARTNLIVLQNHLKSKYRIFLQQIFNYFFALILLPLLLPIIGILAFLIKKESPGPVFFAHKRVGKNGKMIPTYKFRSMYEDAQERLEKLLNENERIKEEWETNFKLKNDPRITKIGAFLRKTSLDELPQIFNVLRGEMNFVGPRPVIQKELDMYYQDNAQYYLMVKPGITGLWQVSGRSDTDYDFRVKLDKWYVINWSIWLDIVILIKTIKVVLLKEGAY
jgi:lipopolysaccharide/colanic/teichoic acid biosynthesis glycosyltransferase